MINFISIMTMGWWGLSFLPNTVLICVLMRDFFILFYTLIGVL